MLNNIDIIPNRNMNPSNTVNRFIIRFVRIKPKDANETNPIFKKNQKFFPATIPFSNSCEIIKTVKRMAVKGNKKNKSNIIFIKNLLMLHFLKFVP